MQGVYSFSWDVDAGSPNGVAYYMLNVNGDNFPVYANSVEYAIEESTDVHAELVAVDNNGNMSAPAVIDFSVPAYVPDVPFTPNNFGAVLVRWQ